MGCGSLLGSRELFQSKIGGEIRTKTSRIESEIDVEVENRNSCVEIGNTGLVLKNQDRLYIGNVAIPGVGGVKKLKFHFNRYLVYLF